MKCPNPPRLPRRWLLAIATGMIAATGTASAQSCGTGGCAFWATEVNDSWFNPFRWGGILPWQGGVPNSSVSCRIELPVQVDLLGQGQAGSCHHLQFNHVGAVVRVAGSSTRAELNVHGTQMDNNGLILIGGQDALQDSSLIIHNNTNANGANGRIRLSAPPNHGAFLSASNNLGWLLVNWPSQTIEGNGTVRVRLQNDGLVDANVPGRSLTFESGHTIDNNHLVRARNGGTLVLSMPNGDFGFRQSAAGRIVIENGSGLVLSGAGNLGLSGGRLQTIGTGVATVITQGFRIENVHLEAGSRLNFFGNTGIQIGPLGLRNDGLIQTGPSGFVTSRFGESTTLTGSGRLQLEGGLLANLFGGAGHAMVNAAGHAIGGVGTIALALTNRGTVSADRNGQSSGPGELRFQTSAQANEGVIEARDGGVVRIADVTLDQSTTGQLRALDSSAVALTGSTTPSRVRGGSIFTSGSGVVVADGSNDVLESVRIEAGSQVRVPCARTLKLVGNIDQRGRITLDNSGCGPSFATLRGEGGATLIGIGEVRLQANASGANTTLESDAVTFTLGSGQVLTGTGRVSGLVRIDGVVMPDQSFAPLGPVGRLTLNAGAQLTLGSSARILVDVRSPADFDRIDGGGSITVGGRLVLNFLDGYVPTVGSSLDLITGTAVTGSLSGIELPAGLGVIDARAEVLPDRLRVHYTVPLFRDGFEG